MLNLFPTVEIYFCLTPADMRRSFDGLARMAEEHLQRQVLGGGMFVFVNKARDRLKLLWFAGDGYCLFSKRLERGRFALPVPQENEQSVSLNATELTLMVGGIDLAQTKKRKRYQHQQAV